MCNKCNNTGIVKFKRIELAMYSWQPWETKPCNCEAATQQIISNHASRNPVCKQTQEEHLSKGKDF